MEIPTDYLLHWRLEKEAHGSNHYPSLKISITRDLKSQNFTGILPPEFARLSQLRHLDLSRNLFNGSIPYQWAGMRLTDVSVMGNRLSGPFPVPITNMLNLVNVSLEGNHFSGSIPSEIGNLVNLKKLVLSSNAFTGELPVAFSKLTSLTDLRISDNNFTGKILRSCLIHGEIPEYVGNMKKLNTLDLSFNNLTGDIPASFVNLAEADFLYLTRNSLTGIIPGWVLVRNKSIDMSYNNFRPHNSLLGDCPHGSLGGILSCLKQEFPCLESIANLKADNVPSSQHA